MHGYTEVFAPAPLDDPGKIFYTITEDDAWKTVIRTTAGLIHVGSILGRVLPSDTGRRLYRIPLHDRSDWIWQAENDAQRATRLAASR